MENTENINKGKWNILLVVLMATFVIVIDSTAMNVSISNIVTDLQTTVEAVQSIISFYALVMASCMLFGAKLSDILGKKVSFRLGLMTYATGTLIAAFSQNVMMLAIGWAVIEGIAAAIMMPAVLSIIVTNYEGQDRAKAMSIYATVAAVALAIGPIVGGVVTTYLSWRFIFGGEAFVVIIAILFSGVIPKDLIEKDARPKIDYVGFLFSGIGLFFIILGFLNANVYGWFFEKNPLIIGGVEISLFGLSASFLSILLGICLLIILLFWLNRRIKNEKPALFHPQMFTNNVFFPAILVYLFGQMSFAGIMFCMPVFMQNALNYNAMDTGISLMPLSIALLISSLFVTKLVYRFSPKVMIIAGLLSIMAGITLMRAQFWGEFSAISGSSFIFAFLFIGFGVGVAFSIAYNLALSNVKPAWKNEGSGMLLTFQNLGNSSSIAVAGSVLFSSVFSNIAQGIVDANFSITSGLSKTQIQEILIKNINTFKDTLDQGVNISPETAQQIEKILTNALSISMDHVGLVLTILVGIGLLLAIFVLPNAKLEK
ncbi:MFS transporter [Eubacteriaceae bacterium ES3]|nr:MFS transporter [Eubacteriaceae bacterium ES3]